MRCVTPCVFRISDGIAKRRWPRSFPRSFPWIRAFLIADCRVDRMDIMEMIYQNFELLLTVLYADFNKNFFESNPRYISSGWCEWNVWYFSALFMVSNSFHSNNHGIFLKNKPDALTIIIKSKSLLIDTSLSFIIELCAILLNCTWRDLTFCT